MAEFDRPTVAARADAGLAIDEGLRAYMLKVYNYMGIGLVVTGLVSYFTYTQSFIEQGGQIVGSTNGENVTVQWRGSGQGVVVLTVVSTNGCTRVIRDTYIGATQPGA